MTSSSSTLGLGSLTTNSTGGAAISGTLFGIDLNTLIGNLVDAKGLVNNQRQDKINQNTLKLSGYSTLQSALSALQSSVNALRNPQVTTGISDAFDAKNTLSTASGTIPASSLFGISATSSASNGTYSLTVNRVAKTDTVSGTVAIADKTTAHPISVAGNIVINGTSVALTDTMTLEQVKDAINNQSNTTGVKASIIQSGANDFRIVLKGTTTGRAINLTGTDANVLTDLGVASSGATDTSLSAEIVLDGVTITRASNSVNDLIPGLSIELFQADPGKAATVKVDTDLSGIGTAVATFITSYNAVVDFVQQQRAVGADGSVGDGQVLFNDNLMQAIYRGVQNAVGTGALGIPTGALKSLRDIGIDLDQTGHLVSSDDNKFQDALLGNLDQVRSLFGFAGNASSGFDVVDHPKNIPATLVGQSIKVRVTATDANGVPTAAEFERNGNVTAATISNGFIRGLSGSEYDGFVVGYTGGVVTSGTPFEGTFNPTQGIADQIFSSLDAALNTTSGTLKLAQDALTATNTRINTQITDFKTQLDVYRTRLTLQFQAAQQAIQALESQKTSIQSYVDSLNAKS